VNDADRPGGARRRGIDARTLSDGAGSGSGAAGSGSATRIEDSRALAELTFRAESGRVLATLIRLLGGDFDAAEEALADAFVIALETWPRDGAPVNPGAWLTVSARNRALDRLRRAKRQADKLAELESALAPASLETTMRVGSETRLVDDRLRLIFTCCHPALPLEARVALTLRTLGGLSTPEIARAFLVPEATLAQRLVRARRKIREAAIPYRVPPDEAIAERLDGVLATIYLVFNEGYAASGGDALVRADLCREAIRLARLVAELMPDRTEPLGLLALLLLQDSRRAARTAEDGSLVLLEDQDRGRWDREEIAEGTALVQRAWSMLAGRGATKQAEATVSQGGRPPGAAATGGTISPAGSRDEGRPGTYLLQASIAAQHARTVTGGPPDWAAIASLYGLLAVVAHSPVVELNRAVAVAEAVGPEAGLEVVERVVASGSLGGYHLLHATRADMLRRLGRNGEALAAYLRATSLCGNETERAFLERRIAELATPQADMG
jgi:RNA polymerase sigma-70 factor (ECF subfamily)